MTIKACKKQGLIGGTSDDLDSIDGAALANDDFAVVMAEGNIYNYALDETSGALENSPNIIKPDTNAGTKRWVLQSVYLKRETENDIGMPGESVFGVGVCPSAFLPPDFVPLPGYTTIGHNNYGNYQYPDGSIMVFVPKFFYKIGTGSNGLDINMVDIKPDGHFGSTIEANANGYVLHRAFVDGGDEQLGFFVDKYICSQRALGTGYVASSIAGGLPISTAPTHNPIADLTACAGNYYYETINAAHARDGINGAVNVDSIFFVSSQYIKAALALLAMAHGQASTSTTYCAWYDSAGNTNFPKGCNDNALGDTNDPTIAYTSDGYSNCGKTGSGVPFAKTTHNGQACGVADLNGLMWEISLGVTCIATSKTITAATQANPCQITVVGHGRVTGDYVQVGAVVGMTQLNDKIYTITVIDANNITLNGVDSSVFSAYTSGGTATAGDFYTAKESTSMKDFTSGHSAATDHWGTTGVAAMMEVFAPAFNSAYPSNGFTQRMGSGANQVLSEAINGNLAILTSLGIPKDGDGADTAGTNLFGKDYFYQYIRNELCVLSGGSWNNGSSAGVWNSNWNYYRSDSSSSVGFRCACYPV